MNKRKMIKDFLKALNEQFMEEEELTVSFERHSGLNIEPLEEMTFDCGTVTVAYTDESLSYAAELKKFFYVGDIAGHNAGGNKSEFILAPSLVEILPTYLTQILQQVAQAGKDAVVVHNNASLNDHVFDSCY